MVPKVAGSNPVRHPKLLDEAAKLFFEIFVRKFN